MASSRSEEHSPFSWEIRLPGSFVVLQGLPGDGLANTMDTLPICSLSDDATRATTTVVAVTPPFTLVGADAATTPQLDPRSSSGSVTCGVWRHGLELFPGSTSTSLPVAAAAVAASASRSVTSATTGWDAEQQLPSGEATKIRLLDTSSHSHGMEDDSFIVVENQDDEHQQQPQLVHDDSRIVPNDLSPPYSRKFPRHTEPSSSLLDSSFSSETRARQEQQPQQQQQLPEDQEILQTWREDCWKRQCDQYQEWHDNNRDNHHLYFQSSQAAASFDRRRHYDSSHDDTAPTTTTPQFTPTNQPLWSHAWWLGPNGYLAVLASVPTTECPRPAVLGTVAPGSTIVATALVTIHSRDYHFIQSLSKKNKDVYPTARHGWIQLLQIEYTTPATTVTLTTVTATSTNSDDTITPHQPAEQPPSKAAAAATQAFVVLSRDGYWYLGPGLPADYVQASHWMWRVTCLDGAVVRQGLELSAQQIATIPYGSLVQVRKKMVNAMGLSRLHVTAVIHRDYDHDTTSSTGSTATTQRQLVRNDNEQHCSNNNNANDDDSEYDPAWTTETITGWCSEFLNPQSGQNGSIMEPLPFPVPALYRVTDTDGGVGAIIRSGVELSHPQIGHAPPGAILTVTGRAFSEHPADRCIERLRLAGNGGWISLKLNKNPPDDCFIAEMHGLDPTFDPQEAGHFHLKAIRTVRRQQDESTVNEQQQQRHQFISRILLPHPAISSLSSSSPQEEIAVSMEHACVSPSISSVAEDDVGSSSAGSSVSSSPQQHHDRDHDQSSTAGNGGGHTPSGLSSLTQVPPICTYMTTTASTATTMVTRSPHAAPTRSGMMLCLDSSPPHNLVRTNDPPQQGGTSLCLICWCAERTATMVHGGTGHIACCLQCARILKARKDPCPVCRLPIDAVIQHFWA